MISSQVTMVIDNDRHLSELFYNHCVLFMRKRGWLTGTNRFAEPDVDMAKAMGEMVENFLWNLLRVKTGVTDDEKSFLSSFMVILFSNIDFENVGAYYWQKTRERYLYVPES